MLICMIYIIYIVWYGCMRCITLITELCTIINKISAMGFLTISRFRYNRIIQEYIYSFSLWIFPFGNPSQTWPERFSEKVPGSPRLERLLTSARPWKRFPERFPEKVPGKGSQKASHWSLKTITYKKTIKNHKKP